MADSTEAGPLDAPAAPRRGVVVAAAILLDLLLVDAAVETFAAGASVRWVVAGAVAVFLAVTLLLRRKLSLETTASAALLILIGLLAFSAWQPRGLDAGVVLLRQSTSTLLAGVTMIAIGAAGWILLHARLLPFAGKIVAGLLTLYGVVSVAWGLAARTSYANLFHGQSAWTHLPFWLQGAFVGGLVVVPIAVAVQVPALWLSGAGGKTLSRTGWFFSLVGSVLIAAAGASASASFVPSAVLTASSEAASSPAVTPFVIATDELALLVRAYQHLPSTPEHPSRSVKATALTFHGDIAATFAFVRDRIANEVYRGVLRGPSGALAAAAANDADKALLLGRLLVEQGYQVRYVYGTLDEDRAKERLAAVFRTMTPTPSPELAQLMEAALVHEGVPERRAATIAAAFGERRHALQAAVQQTARADLATISSALQKAGILPSPRFEPSALLDELRPHYWVQVESGATWQDLDATFVTAQPGQTFCPATEAMSAIPPEGYQGVTVRVRNEFLEGKGLRSTTVLEQYFPAHELHGQSIVFTNVPLPASALATGGVTACERFVPVLIIGGTRLAGRPSAVIRANEGDAQPGESVTNELFGEAESAKPSAARLVAQWLDFELTAPGRAPSIVSRAIVDAVRSTERAAGVILSEPDLDWVKIMLAQPYGIAVSTGVINEADALAAGYAHVDAQGVALIASTAARDSGVTAGALGEIAKNQLGLVAARALSLASTLDRMRTAPWVATYPHARVFRDQPAIVLASIGIERTGGDHWGASFAYDIRHDVVRVLAEDSRWTEEAFWLNAHHGTVDAAAERHLLWCLGFHPSDAGQESVTQVSTSSLAERDRRADRPWKAYGPGNAVDWLRTISTAGDRLARELGPASAVVGPARSTGAGEDLGIWTVDLETGHVVAALDSGLRGSVFEGQATIEELTKEATEYQELYIECQFGGFSPSACRLLIEGFSRTIQRMNLEWRYRALVRDIIEVMG